MRVPSLRCEVLLAAKRQSDRRAANFAEYLKGMPVKS
jgi:hypothetical protein